MGIKTEKTWASVGAKLWTDQSYEVTEQPDYLDGTILFQGHYTGIAEGTVITITSPRKSKLYVAILENADGGLSNILPNEGWKLQLNQVALRDQIKFADRGSASFHSLNRIWMKEAPQNSISHFQAIQDDLTFAIFVKEGNTLIQTNIYHINNWE